MTTSSVTVSSFFNHRDFELPGYATVGENANARSAILGTLDLYPSRALCLTKPGDIIQLPKALGQRIWLWDFIQQHYSRVGLEVTDKVLWTDSTTAYFPYHTTHLDFSHFIASPRFCGNVKNEESYAKVLTTTKLLNSKNSFMDLCSSMGIKVPKTLQARDLKDLSLAPATGYLKAACSVSGLGVVKYSSHEELLNLLKGLKDWQIQEDVMPTDFLNVQYVFDENGWKFLETTEQLLDGNSHIGNVCPPKYSFDPNVYEKLLSHLHYLGYRGVLGMDVLVSGTSEYLVECNPRFNGSTYPTVIAQRLGIKNWCSIASSCDTQKIKRLLESHEFDGIKGIVIFNWGALLASKVGILIAGDKSYQKQIINLFV